MTTSKIPKLPKNCKIQALVSCLFEGGRVAIEPIIALYIFSFGFDLGDYATTKAAYIAVFFILDIPIAFLLNRIGERKSIFLALFCAMVGSVGYILSRSIVGFCISEAFIALSISLYNPAASSLSLRICEKTGIKGMDGKYFHLLGSMVSIVVFLTGIMGGFLFNFNRQLPFILYVLTVFLAFLAFRRSTAEDGVKERNFIPKIEKSTLKGILPFLPLGMLLYGLVDPLALYWQPLLVEKFEATAKITTLFFATYSSTYSITAFLISRSMTNKKITNYQVLIFAPILGSIFYLILPKSDSFFLLSLLFAACWAFSEVTVTSICLEIRRKMPSNQRMFLGKIASLFFRSGSIIAVVSSKFLIGQGFSTEQILSVYGKICFGFVFSSLLGMSIYFFSKNKIFHRENLENLAKTS